MYMIIINSIEKRIMMKTLYQIQVLIFIKTFIKMYNDTTVIEIVDMFKLYLKY